MQSDGLNSTLGPVVYGDIAPSVNTNTITLVIRIVIWHTYLYHVKYGLKQMQKDQLWCAVKVEKRLK